MMGGMKEIKKTVPVLEHEDGMTRRFSDCSPDDAPVDVYSTPSRETGQAVSGLLMDYLPHGAAFAITGAELAKILGCTPREITRSIESLRRRGVPVCASCREPRGYYLASDPEELRDYLRILDSRLREIRSTRAACRDTLAVLYGQTEVESW